MRKKTEQYQLMNAQLEALIHDVPHHIANMANAAALLYHTLEDINWAGFYLMKNGKIAEESLDKQTEKIRDKDYHFKIINPKSIIIMGHTSNYTQQQKDDFEVIKRKYTNVLDIISYEDLIHRLETIINTLKVEKGD